MRLFISLLLMLLLVGCAGIKSNNFDELDKFAIEDVQVALDSAMEQGDRPAINCYSTLLDVIRIKSETSLPKIKGVVSAFQATRNAIDGSGRNNLMKQINLGCAALFVETNYTILKMGLSIFPVPVPLP